MRDVCLWKSSFIDSDFSGSDFRGVYWEDAFLRDIYLNYLSKFDIELRPRWRNRSMPKSQCAEILRNIRVGYEKAELWQISDRFLYAERKENRKHIIFPKCREKPKLQNIGNWAKDLLFDWIAGYGTKPHRVISIGFFISIFFSVIYFFLGTPSAQGNMINNIFESLYFSFTTFATLGYGDISYGADRELMRLLSTGEAWCGAVFISLFVAVLARRFLR